MRPSEEHGTLTVNARRGGTDADISAWTAVAWAVGTGAVGAPIVAPRCADHGGRHVLGCRLERAC
jgi:hypothetical protein